MGPHWSISPQVQQLIPHVWCFSSRNINRWLQWAPMAHGGACEKSLSWRRSSLCRWDHQKLVELIVENMDLWKQIKKCDLTLYLAIYIYKLSIIVIYIYYIYIYPANIWKRDQPSISKHDPQMGVEVGWRPPAFSRSIRLVASANRMYS